VTRGGSARLCYNPVNIGAFVLRLARFVILPGAILLFTSGAFAQQRRAGDPNPNRFGITGAITGEADHKPIAGAQVVLNSAGGSVVNTVTAGSDGRYLFENVAVGRYTIVFSAPGYDTVRQEVAILSGASTLDVTLRKTLEKQAGDDATENAVSARELSLPSKAQDALAKGKDHLYQQHDAAGSLPYFHKVLEISPDFYEAYYHEGIAYGFQKQTVDAEEAFRKAIAGGKGHFADPCFALASILIDQKQLGDAKQLADEGLQAQPDDWRGYYELTRIYLMLGQYKDAEKNGIEASKRKADFPGLYLMLANIHMQLRDNESVLADVNTFLKLDPSGPNSEQARAIKSQVERALGRAPAQDPPARQ
jgi:Flp pilus assembly protein TadD